jgi:hypothetical protein
MSLSPATDLARTHGVSHQAALPTNHVAVLVDPIGDAVGTAQCADVLDRVRDGIGPGTVR